MENAEDFMEMIKRMQRFSGGAANIETFTDAEKATLPEVVAAEYYPLRSIDIERMASLAAYHKNTKEGEAAEEPIRVLDLGGGKGLLAKLLADRLSRSEYASAVIDLDRDAAKLTKAAEFYKQTPNLHFVASDSEKEAGDLFAKELDLAIVSWAHSPDDEGVNYDATIQKLHPRFFVNVGDMTVTFTGSFNGGDAYRKLGEWPGPISQEIKTGQVVASVFGEEEKRVKQTGSNLFEVYVRNDMAEQEIQQVRQILLDADNGKKEEFPWEKELKEYYPKKSDIVFEDASET